MSLTLLTPALIIVVAAFIFIGSLIGYRAGMIRSALNLASVIASAFLSIAIAVFGVLRFKDAIIGHLEDVGILGPIKEAAFEFADIVDPLVCMLFSAILFIPVFIIVCLVFVIAESIIFKILAKRDKNSEYLSEQSSYLEKRSKSIGAFIGAFCGLVMSIVIFSPVTGALRTMSDVMVLTNELAKSEDFDVPDEMKIAESFSDDFMVIAMDSLGGGAVFDMITTTNCFGVMTNLSTEIGYVNGIGLGNIEGIIGQIFTPGEEGEQALAEFMGYAERSPIIKMILLSGLKEMADAWLVGDQYMGTSRPDFSGNNMANVFFDQLLSILATSKFDTVIKDFKTLVALGNILKEYEEVFATADFAGIMAALAEGNVIERLKDELGKNSHMLPIVPAVDDMVMQAVAEEISNVDKFSYFDRMDIYDSIAESLTSTKGINLSTRTDIVVEELDNVLGEFGVTVPADVSEKVVSMLISDVASNKSTISRADVEKYIESFLSGSDSPLE